MKHHLRLVILENALHVQLLELHLLKNKIEIISGLV
jgi:hypothetical protein